MSQPGNGREVANDYLSASYTDVLILFLQEEHLGMTPFTPPGAQLSQSPPRMKGGRTREMLTDWFLF